MTHKERTLTLLSRLVLPSGQFKDKAPLKSDIKEMFLLYNEVHNKKEAMTSCGGCRRRVLNNLIKYAKEHYGYEKS